MHNPDKEFSEFLFNFDKKKTIESNAILEDKFLESHLHVVKDTNLVPLPTKISSTPVRQTTITKRIVSTLNTRGSRRDSKDVKAALSRVVKRIMIIKRLNIIKQVNEVIEKVSKAPLDESKDKLMEENKAMSAKKLVKIMNLCSIYIPLVQIEPNNSTKISLDVGDLAELTKSKEKYREFVHLQAKSFEIIIRDSYIDGEVQD
jgi:hypothetical protein